MKRLFLAITVLTIGWLMSGCDPDTWTNLPPSGGNGGGSSSKSFYGTWEADDEALKMLSVYGGTMYFFAREFTKDGKYHSQYEFGNDTYRHLCFQNGKITKIEAIHSFLPSMGKAWEVTIEDIHSYYYMKGDATYKRTEMEDDTGGKVIMGIGLDKNNSDLLYFSSSAFIRKNYTIGADPWRK